MKKNKRGIQRIPQHVCHRASDILSQIKGTPFDAEHPEHDYWLVIPFLLFYSIALAWWVIAW